MTEPLLHTTAIAKSFGPVVALRSVALSVQPGEVHALLGANGAGKSTMVKILTGVLRPDSGDIAVNGTPVQLRKPSDARRHGLAPVFQDPALVPDLTIRENLRLTGTDIGEVRRQLTDMDLSGLDLDELVRDVPLPFLRMLDLARAMSLDPQLLLLDEITAALPPDLSDVVFDVMRQVEATRPQRAVHLASAGRGPRALRHVHGAARRPRGGLVRAWHRRGAADRAGHAGRSCGRHP